MSTNVITAMHMHTDTSCIRNKSEDTFFIHSTRNMVNKESTELKTSEFYFSNLLTKIRVRGGAVGWGTALQSRRSRIRFLMVSLEFFIDVILPATLWPWGRLSL
jgi:hypothetical protein